MKNYMTYGNSELCGVSICYFCEEEIQIGDLLYADSSNPILASKKPHGFPIGISLHNVVIPKKMEFYLPNPDDWYEVPSGSKIQIMQKGEIVGKFPKWWKLPVGQKLYYDVERDKITWRRTPVKYGKTSSSQDELGFIKILVKF